MQKSIYKISFVTIVFRGDGVEKNITNLANYLTNELYQIQIVAGKAYGDVQSQLSNNIKFINLNTTSPISLFFALFAYFKKEKPDILISSGVHVNIISLMAKIFSLSNTKIILKEINTFSLLSSTARNTKNRFLARFVLPYFVRFFYPRANHIICVSHGVAKDLLHFFPILKKVNISIIHNAISDKLISRLALEPVDHSWFVEAKEPIILAVARLVVAKDYPTLLRAFRLVFKKKPCRLVVLGEGEEKNKLEKLSQEIGISNNLDFLGFQKNPFKYMVRASVFVLSSIEEGFGTVLIEAMYCGLPVIATKCAGPLDIIENRKNGILVPIGDETTIAEMILEVLSNNSLAKKMSEEGEKRAQNFTIVKVVEKYDKLFRELLV